MNIRDTLQLHEQIFWSTFFVFVGIPDCSSKVITLHTPQQYTEHLSNLLYSVRFFMETVVLHLEVCILMGEPEACAAALGHLPKRKHSHEMPDNQKLRLFRLHFITPNHMQSFALFLWL